MDILLRNNINGEHLQKINHCRLHLQVHTKWDILTVDENGILAGVLQGERARKITLSWHEKKVPETWWETWSSYVSEWIKPTIRDPLTPEITHHHIDIWVSSDENTLVVEGVNHRYQNSITRQKKYKKTEHEATGEIQPCDIERREGYVVLKAGTLLVEESHEITKEAETSFDHYSQKMDNDKKSMKRGILTSYTEVQEIGRSIKEGSIFVATYVSSQRGRNTYALCLGYKEDSRRWYTWRKIEGWPIASDRAELQGSLL